MQATTQFYASGLDTPSYQGHWNDGKQGNVPKSQYAWLGLDGSAIIVVEKEEGCAMKLTKGCEDLDT